MSYNQPKILVAGNNGKIHELPDIEPAGMKAGKFFRLHSRDLIKLPYGSELFMLPGRAPVGYDSSRSNFTVLSDKKDRLNAVAAFVSPGYTGTFSAAFLDAPEAKPLPLFSYSAVCLYKGEYYAAAVRVDSELRQDLRYIDMSTIKKNVKSFRKLFPKNRLMRHLEKCALVYGCPAGKNFFMQRYEAPLPTSPTCNANCLGCISYQPNNVCPVTQPRIKFIPNPEEIAETALFHIANVKDPVVSFGQGCEGEPLLAGYAIEKAVKLIRARSGKGIINLNTNASKPDIVARLFEAGLDSIRVSMNSVQEKYYDRYYSPRGYTFEDVLRSIDAARTKGKFVSINYLVMPGLTDSPDEVESLHKFIKSHKINMIQWRNMNFDPVRYFGLLGAGSPNDMFCGIDNLILDVKKRYPMIMHGYFNPSKGRMKRFSGKRLK